jgi:tRNA-uridine 2-sulfurtransferase
MKPRVLVAMSGGVDSSVAASMLAEDGYDVIGVAMRLAPEASLPLEKGEGEGSGVARRRGTCCSHDDFEDARRVSERMGFPFYVVDLRAEFSSRVIGNFVSEYVSGRTPNPCVMCNREIKFDRLWQRARAIGAEFIATGHYARIERDESDAYHLLRAADSSKDQSYFLFNLRQDELARTLFPLGDLTKSEVRARARVLGLANADKPESQEICFVPDGDYARFVERAAPAEIRRGRVIGTSGRAVAEHAGIHRFTVGQRRGLGVAAGEPMYVREIRADTAEVIVGSRDELRCAGLLANEVSLVSPEIARDREISVEVKIRYRHPALAARLRMKEPRRAEVRFSSDGPAVTPGQACVFYRGDEVLGGGFIERAL